MEAHMIRALACFAILTIGFLGLALTQDSKKPWGLGIPMALFALIVLAAIAAQA